MKRWQLKLQQTESKKSYLYWHHGKLHPQSEELKLSKTNKIK